MRGIDIHELGALEAMLLVIGYRAVENRLAGDAMIADGGVARRIVRRIQRVATNAWNSNCLLYTSPSPRDVEESRMPSSA